MFLVIFHLYPGRQVPRVRADGRRHRGVRRPGVRASGVPLRGLRVHHQRRLHAPHWSLSRQRLSSVRTFNLLKNACYVNVCNV